MQTDDGTKERLKQMTETQFDTFVSNRFSIHPFPRIEGHNNDANHSFYRTFNEKLGRARRSVTVVGEGVIGDSRAEIEDMKSYVQSHETALINNPDLIITRIQTNPFMTKAWSEKLSYLIQKYPDRFKLFMGPKQIVYAFVADSYHAQNCCVEMMMPIRAGNNQMGEDAQKEIAGLGVFLDGDRAQAQFIEEKISQMIRTKMSLSEFDAIAQARLEAHSDLSPHERTLDQNALLNAVVEVSSCEEMNEYCELVERLK